MSEETNTQELLNELKSLNEQTKKQNEVLESVLELLNSEETEEEKVLNEESFENETIYKKELLEAVREAKTSDNVDYSEQLSQLIINTSLEDKDSNLTASINVLNDNLSSQNQLIGNLYSISILILSILILILCAYPTFKLGAWVSNKINHSIFR